MERPAARPIALGALLALTVLGAGTALADALVETDTERLDEIVEMLRATDGARVDRLATYADPERVAVRLSSDGHSERVGDGDVFRDRLHEVLSPLDTEDTELVQITSQLTGDEGRITLRVRADGELTDLELTVRREGQTFLLVGARRLG